MALTVDDYYKICLYAINKSNSGDLSDSEFNLLIEAAELSWVNFLLGAPEQYQYARPIPRVQFSMNETTRQKLSPLIGDPVTLTIDSSGNAPYPADYIATDTMFTSTMGKVKFVKQEQLASYLESTIDPVSSNPIYLIRKGKFQFYPTTLGTAKLSYVKIPTPMRWVGTADSNGRLVYSSGLSTQPTFPDIDAFEIISRLLKIVGVNLQLPILMQYAQQVEKGGS